MAYTQQQIDRIHADKSAKAGFIYAGPNKTLYVGSQLGHLIQESYVNGEASGTTLRLLINNIGQYSREEIVEILTSVSEKLDKTEFEDYKKEAKCFTIAMSIAL